MKLFRS